VDQRIAWDELPGSLKDAIEARTGRIASVRIATAGQNSPLAAIIETADGKVFAKGMPSGHRRVITQAREAAVAPFVRDISPALLWHFDEAGWNVLGYEYAPGRHADYTPGSPDLDRLVRSPVFSSEDQLRALAPILERSGIGGLAAQFIKLCAANRRLFAIRDMVRAYRELVVREKGEATANVTVAEELKPQHLSALRAALKAVSGKEVDLDVKIDPAIIGGLVVKLGSRMVDTSLRTKLNAIRHAMKEAR